MSWYRLGRFGTPLSEGGETGTGRRFSTEELVIAGEHGMIRSQNYNHDAKTGWCITGNEAHFFGLDVTLGPGVGIDWSQITNISVDMDDLVAGIIAVSVGPTAPATPSDGDLWLDTTTHRLMRWDATLSPPAWTSAVDFTELTGTIAAEQIFGRIISAEMIVAGAITAYEIASHTITADQIYGGTITATEIAAGTITADRIDIDDLFAQVITLQPNGVFQTNSGTTGGRVRITSANKDRIGFHSGSVFPDYGEAIIHAQNNKLRMVSGYDYSDTYPCQVDLVPGTGVNDTYLDVGGWVDCQGLRRGATFPIKVTNFSKGTWTPTLAGTTTSPSPVTNTSGSYVRNGYQMSAWAVLTAGSSFSAGNGYYYISLPDSASSSLSTSGSTPNGSNIGSVYFRQASSGMVYIGAVTLRSSTTAFFAFDADNGRAEDNDPVTPADGDVWTFNLNYQVD